MTLMIILISTHYSEIRAQYTQGNSGLLTIPTADMQPDGTFMVGTNYMPKEITPQAWDYNTANYFLNITFLPFLEVGYLCTLIKLDTGKINQDRALSVRLRALKEAKWYPSIVVGTNDALSMSQNNINPLESVDANRYYSSIYGVATKHFDIKDECVGVTIGYNFKTQDHSFRNGVFYGISYRPSFYTNCEFMADIDSKCISIGAATKVFNHLSINAFCYDLKTFVGGVRYEVKLY